MGDKEKDDVIEWANNMRWEKYAGNKDIMEGLTNLKQKVTTIEGEGGSAGANQRIKLVVVGDGAVGKTSLLMSFAKNKFPEDYVPTVFENYTAKITREDGSNILLHLWDTAGQEDYDRLRPLSYPGADIVLLCFSTVTASSLTSVKEKWYPEVNHYVPDTPYILVGTKLDLREDNLPDPSTGESNPVKTTQGEEMKKTIKAVRYVEVSAKTRKNLEKLFQEAVDVVLQVRRSHGEDVPSSTTTTTTNNNNNTANGTSNTKTDGKSNEDVGHVTRKKRRGACNIF